MASREFGGFFNSRRVRFFRNTMRRWFVQNGVEYPWRREADPFKIIVAESLLQRTNADKVARLFGHLLAKYPDPHSMALAEVDSLASMLEPLGLNYKAERLKRLAACIAGPFHGRVPDEEDCLMSLPGVGRYICGAVLCFAYSKRVAILDSNVVRLYERVFGVSSNRKRPRDDVRLWDFCLNMLPQQNAKDFNFALLDFSGKICMPKKPKCTQCPLESVCSVMRNFEDMRW